MSQAKRAYEDYMDRESGYELQTRPIKDVSKYNDTVRIVEAVEFLNSVGLRVVTPEFGKSE